VHPSFLGKNGWPLSDGILEQEDEDPEHRKDEDDEPPVEGAADVRFVTFGSGGGSSTRIHVRTSSKSYPPPPFLVLQPRWVRPLEDVDAGLYRGGVAKAHFLVRGPDLRVVPLGGR
jgi:hypothetical protein